MTDDSRPTILDDTEIALLLRKGDRGGLRALLEVHGGRIAGVIGSRFGCRVDTNQVLADAAIKVWKHASTFDDRRRTLRAWFTQIAVRCALDIIAAQRSTDDHKSFSEIGDVDHEYDPADTGTWLAHNGTELSHDPRQKQRETALREIVEQLPPSQKVVIEADLAAGGVSADGAELARRLGVPAGTIRVRRNRARKSIRREMIRRGLYSEEGDS